VPQTVTNIHSQVAEIQTRTTELLTILKEYNAPGSRPNNSIGLTPKDAEALAVLDLEFSQDLSYTGGNQQLSEIAIDLAFGWERADMKILRVGFFQHSQLNKGRSLFHDTGLIVDEDAAQHVLVDLKLPESKNATCMAILFKHPGIHDAAALAVKIEIKVKTDQKAKNDSQVQQFLGKQTISMSLKHENKTSRTPFSWAAGNGWVSFCDMALRREGLDLDGVDERGRTALSWAAGNGCDNVVCLLLEQRICEIKAPHRDKNGRTPCSWAAGSGFHKIVEVLLKSCPGIDPDEGDNRGRTPLSWAAEKGYADVVAALLKADKLPPTSTSDGASSSLHVLGVDFDARDQDNETPLSRAARMDCKEVIKVMRLLVREGLKKHPEGEGTSLSWASIYLHRAARRGWFCLARILIREKVKIDSFSADKNQFTVDEEWYNATPLCGAAEMGHLPIVELLLKAGANCNFETPGARDTPLLLALQKKRVEIVKALLEAGADSHKPNASGKTARDLAVQLDLPSISTMLDKRDEDGPFCGTLSCFNISADKAFDATIVDFATNSGTFEAIAMEVPVNELLEGSHKITGKPAFRWFHLPANNVSAQLQILQTK